MRLKVGDKLPLFEAMDDKGNVVNNVTIARKKVIFTFYAKDDTPSCTKQVCSINDHLAFFKERGYEVYGVSPDSIKKHQKFADKYAINFPLIADKDKTMLLKFGFYGPKKFMGKDVNGVYRSAVVVDERGLITHLIDKVVTASHGQQLVETLGLQ